MCGFRNTRRRRRSRRFGGSRAGRPAGTAPLDSRLSAAVRLFLVELDGVPRRIGEEGLARGADRRGVADLEPGGAQPPDLRVEIVDEHREVLPPRRPRRTGDQVQLLAADVEPGTGPEVPGAGAGEPEAQCARVEPDGLLEVVDD